MVLCLLCVCSHGRCSPRAEKEPAATGGRQKSVCQLASVSHSDINPWGVSCLLWHRTRRIHCNRHSGTPWAVFPGDSQQYSPFEKTEGTTNEGEQTQEKQFVTEAFQRCKWEILCIFFVKTLVVYSYSSGMTDLIFYNYLQGFFFFQLEYFRSVPD